MSPAQEPATAQTYPGSCHVLARLRAWLRRGGELASLDPDEIERIADDVGITAPELKDLAARGPHAADELEERMRNLGIGKDDVERIAPGLLRDLQRTCTCCSEKRLCQADLATRPDARAWEGYCPNAVGLTCVKVAKAQLAASP